MSDVIPYALLYETETGDPTTVMGISWIDKTGDGGDTQVVEYGREGDSVEGTESDGGEFIPKSNEVDDHDEAYVYHTVLAGLEPGTRYFVRIDSNETVEHEFETFPEEMPESFDVAVSSDHHPWRSGVGMVDQGIGAAVMENFAEKEYDMILEPGDWMTSAATASENNTWTWLTWWEDALSAMDTDKLYPRFGCAGNHEVSAITSGTWNGSKDDWDYEDLTPETGYFQLFFPNLPALEPTGENYGTITISDYVQFIALDTYSAFPVDQTAWFEDQIRDDIPFVVPFTHAAWLPGAARGGQSHTDLMRLMREEWAPIIADADNVYFTLCGNEHARKVTYPWDVVDEEPAHDEYFDLGDDQYMIVRDEGKEGVWGFGDGWPNARTEDPPIGTWYLNVQEFEDVSEANVKTVRLGSDASIEVTEWDQYGHMIDRHRVLEAPRVRKRLLHETGRNDLEWTPQTD